VSSRVHPIVRANMTTPPSPSPEQQIIGCSLSNFLADRRQRIIGEWISNIRGDNTVPAADGLTPSQLKDHLPQLLDELNQTLCDAFNPQIQERAATNAANHGYLRWLQHYDISQIILEFASLRAVLIYHVAEFHDEQTPNYNGKSGLFAMVVLHSYFDRLIRYSVDQYVATSTVIKRPVE
jgi:hypothetical protein